MKTQTTLLAFAAGFAGTRKVFAHSLKQKLAHLRMRHTALLALFIMVSSIATAAATPAAATDAAKTAPAAPANAPTAALPAPREDFKPAPSNLPGKEYPQVNATTAKADIEALKKAGINAHFYVSPETAHEWQSWWRSLHEFAQLVFKN